MVMVYCEGPTEWYVIRKLWKNGVLSGANLIQPDNADVHIKNNPQSIDTRFLSNLPAQWDKFLLIYDQENKHTPREWIDQNLSHLGEWNKVEPDDNVFCLMVNSRLVYVHINTAPSPNESNDYKDFDGYLLDLIKKVEDKVAQRLFQNLPAYIRSAAPSSNIHHTIHQMGLQDIPDLMDKNKFPIQRSKGIIYAYITALQLSKSHVWFSEKLIDACLQNGYTYQVKQAFQTFINAWDNLIKGKCP
ncbi:MAG: hypothetical protein Q9O62_10570 [Ardenticatenia bacterium]|nr:hypothetical protein [Ardenticatenia bacterium]